MPVMDCSECRSESASVMSALEVVVVVVLVGLRACNVEASL
jgi:hypothetical protein